MGRHGWAGSVAFAQADIKDFCARGETGVWERGYAAGEPVWAGDENCASEEFEHKPPMIERANER